MGKVITNTFKDFDKSKESSYLKCWNVNNLCGWEMLRRLPVDGFKLVENTSKFNKSSQKTTMKMVMRDVFMKLMLNVLKNYMTLTMIYHFLPERMKTEKVEKLLTNLHDQKEYVTHIFFIVHRVIFFLVDRIIKFNQEAWLKSCIDMNIQIMHKNEFFKQQTMEIVRSHRDIKLVIPEARRN